MVTQNLHTREILRTLMDAIPDLICFKDEKGRWLDANQYTLQLYGIDKDAFYKKTDLEIAEVCPLYRDSFLNCMESDEQSWNKGGMIRNIEQIHRGDLILLDVMKIPLYHPDGRRRGLLVIGRDITEQRKSEAQLQYTAEHDALTGLPNRRSFKKAIQSELLKAEKTKDCLALLFLDVDRFKNINDTLGHTVGDMMLQQVSKRLAESLPALKVYRIGGDEFTLILPKSSRDEALQVAGVILQQFETPYEINEHSFFLTASIGIGMYPFDGDDMDSLVANADTAMYQAKASGNRFEFYTKEMNRKLSRAMVLEKELRKALNSRQLEVYYQPKIELCSNHIVGFEALLRWNHPTLGWISPVEFIPLAEDNGLILPITEWVLRTASHFMKALQDEGYPSLHISVNLSPRLFQREDLIQIVAGVLLESGLPSHSLQLEITESVMKEHQRALITLNKMKTLGIQIAVDDFGTGYSSLNYLTQFPIDTLKIDQSFIKNIEKFECAAIVKTIIDMAHHLNLNVIAEGVETMEQLQFLNEQHCVEAQGFYFSKPIPEAEVKGWMLKHKEKLLL